MQSLIKLVVHDSFWHGMKCVLLPVLPLALWHTGLKPYMRYDSFEENIAVALARGSCNFKHIRILIYIYIGIGHILLSFVRCLS